MKINNSLRGSGRESALTISRNNFKAFVHRPDCPTTGSCKASMVSKSPFKSMNLAGRMPAPLDDLGRKMHGYLEIDLCVALAILALAIVPLGYSFTHEQTALRVDYCRAVANEIVDGEMEVLAAGAWKEFPDGSHVYMVHSRAARNLPAGHFELTKTGKHLRLEWVPDARKGVGDVVREINLP
jgi:hypothetical protein